METVRLGRSIRALRVRHGLRQVDLARSSGVSDTVISRIERGRGDRVVARTLDRVANALGARLVVRIDWIGEALDRLLDATHAALVESVAARLIAASWVVEPEVTFAVGSERGSIDLLAWHAGTRRLVVLEIKSVVPDIQAMLAALDRKVRLADGIAAARGWRPTVVGRVLVVGDTRTSRRRIAAFRTTFDSRFPDRVVTMRRFIRDPNQVERLNALWFVPIPTGATARHRMRRPRRPQRGE